MTSMRDFYTIVIEFCAIYGYKLVQMGDRTVMVKL